MHFIFGMSMFTHSLIVLNSSLFDILQWGQQLYQLLIKLRMFNPQRKSKVTDIYMQQKIYRLHRDKMNQIGKSISPFNKRYEQQEEQEKLLRRIQKSKREVKSRLSADVQRENNRLLSRLLETDLRLESNPEIKEESKKHFNSYFSTKRESQRIHRQNYTMVLRMDRLSSEIPSLSKLKKQYKRSRKFAKNCRKLPSIVKYQEEYKKKLSQPYIQSSALQASRRNL